MNKIKDKFSGGNKHAIGQAKEESLKTIKFLELLNKEHIVLDGLLCEPEPDVQLSNNLKETKIGMELVSLNVEKAKPIDMILRRIVKDAWSKFEELHPLNDRIWVSVSFSIHGVLKICPDNDIKNIIKIQSEIVDSLVSIVQRYEERISKMEHLTLNRVFDFNSIYVDRVSIMKTNSKNSSWRIAGGTAVPPVQNVYVGDNQMKDLIELNLAKKRCKPSNYTIPFDELWLLIYANESSNSTLFTLDRFDDDKCYNSPYDKVYLMVEDRLILLNTTK